MLSLASYLLYIYNQNIIVKYKDLMKIVYCLTSVMLTFPYKELINIYITIFDGVADSHSLPEEIYVNITAFILYINCNLLYERYAEVIFYSV